jgi:hypothetical protein
MSEFQPRHRQGGFRRNTLGMVRPQTSSALALALALLVLVLRIVTVW